MQAVGVTRAFTLGATFFRKGRTLHAVNGVDLAIQRGDVVGVVGESGCGKSTLARMLLGLLAPTGGRITLDGQDVAPVGRKAVARRVQPVFQDPYSSLNPRRSIASIVALPLEVHGVGTPAQRRARALEMLDLRGSAPGPSRRQVQRAYRDRLRAAHPDHGMVIGFRLAVTRSSNAWAVCPARVLVSMTARLQ